MLRNVVEGDLPTFFQHQRDPDATSMAAYPAKEWDAFMSHWRHKVLGDPANEARTILVDDQVAGYVASWEQDGRRLVGYWVGREYWGRGVARSALDCCSLPWPLTIIVCRPSGPQLNARR